MARYEVGEPPKSEGILLIPIFFCFFFDVDRDSVPTAKRDKCQRASFLFLAQVNQSEVLVFFFILRHRGVDVRVEVIGGGEKREQQSRVRMLERTE